MNCIESSYVRILGCNYRIAQVFSEVAALAKYLCPFRKYDLVVKSNERSELLLVLQNFTFHKVWLLKIVQIYIVFEYDLGLKSIVQFYGRFLVQKLIITSES